MKKIKSKLLIIILLVLVLTTNVKASVGSCSNGNSVNIKETTMSEPAGFQAYMPICASMTMVSKNPVEAGPGFENLDMSDPTAVGDYAEVWTHAQQAADDNKSTISISVQICNDPNATMNATMRCTYLDYDENVINNYCTEWGKETVEYIDDKCLSNCQNQVILKESGLVENPNVEKMKAIDPIKECNCVKTYQKDVCIGDIIAHYCPNGGSYGYYGGHGLGCGKTEEYIASFENLPRRGGEINAAMARGKCKSENHTDCACFPGSTKYVLMCPVYRCTKGNIKIDVCTPSFQASNGNKVYCVNPGQPFSTAYQRSADYIKDEDFNVRKCESSYSTVDCGYSNILIEGAYSEKVLNRKIDDKTIELALRLWGAYTNQTGFSGVGISNKRGTSCESSVYFMRENGYSGRVINPYVESFKEFRRVLLDKFRYNNFDPLTDYNSFDIACDSNVLGIACGGSAYKQAYALLANTVLGNKNMQEHLDKLFKDEVDEDVRKVMLSNNTEGDQTADIYIDKLKDYDFVKNKKIYCNDLNKMVKAGTLTAEQKAQIEPFCKVNVTFVDGTGKEIKKLGGGTPAYCYKEYCSVIIEEYAMCDVEKEVTAPIKAKVTYTTPNSSMSINKYVSCSNPNNSQFLFGFDNELQENSSKNAGGPGVDYSPYTTEEFAISNYKCAGQCSDYSLRGEVKSSCGDDNNNYNNTYNSSVKDPSLKCILNMGSPAIKNMYDYSDEFGVNTNLCKIYCSDEIEYFVADKTKATSGEYFYYDIEKNVRSEKNVRYLFTNVIREKRTCVSEIYYNNNFTETVDWKGMYGLGVGDGISTTEINGIKNLDTLLNVMIKKAEAENGRTENINKLLYDLYNCNLYSEKAAKDAGLSRPQNYTGVNFKDTIVNKFSTSENYGIGRGQNCTINGNTNTCVTMKNVNYEFGAEPSGKSSEMKSVTSHRNTLNNLVYCSGYGCFAYDETAKDTEYNYPTNTTSEMTERSLGSLSIGGKSKIKIPTNDYVMFKVETDVSFYNATRFEVKPSGEVIIAGTNTSQDSYLKLNAFSYPIYKDAYNLPICSERDFLDNSEHRCAITQQYDKVATYFRNNPSDEFSTRVNLSNTFTCYVDVRSPRTVSPASGCNKSGTCSLSDSTMFRNVDVSNVFPSSKDGYTMNKGSNWDTSNGKKTTDSILNSANDLITTDDYLEYRIVLSPNQIKNLKEYNKENDSYVNEEQQKCQIVDDTYQNCTSPFMDELRRNDTYGSIDDTYRNGISNHQSIYGKD